MTGWRHEETMAIIVRCRAYNLVSSCEPSNEELQVQLTRRAVRGRPVCPQSIVVPSWTPLHILFQPERICVDGHVLVLMVSL